MEFLDLALLVNIVGFAAGIVLYAMLGVMVVSNRNAIESKGVERLLLIAAALGTVWNLGELLALIAKDIGVADVSPFIAAAAYSALGFLPSVVVHTAQRESGSPRSLTVIAYLLSASAMAINFAAAFQGGKVPALFAMRMHAVGAVVLGLGLMAFSFNNTLKNRTILASALLIFALSALHIGFGSEGSYWYVELAAHQSSLPLVFVILYQNFRFAFADLFLKRALSLLLLAAIATVLYVFAATPLLRYHETHDRNDMFAAAIILGLWIATALAYPLLHRMAVYLVDRFLLDRPDYPLLISGLEKKLVEAADETAALDLMTSSIREAITARRVEITNIDETSFDLMPNAGDVTIPTVESPFYNVRFMDLEGARRLMSDETTMISLAANITARRIDSLRVSHERCEQEFHTEEMQKLAAEAQLTALRAQINPHFLFNALTTIGYLIRSSPDKAYDTLMRLTQLLRKILSSHSDITTLSEELDLVKNYLEIERARFEDKLNVELDIDQDAANASVPPLIIQPLVENAIKHGISANRSGGTVRIAAKIDVEDNSRLRIEVWDSGAGRSVSKKDNEHGIGLMNIRKRLENYYGVKATLELLEWNGGTLAVILLPQAARG